MKFALFSAALLASSFATAATPVNGWYASVYGGYAYLPTNVSKYNLRLIELKFSAPSYKDGYNLGARLGYQSNPLRYELEYFYVQATPKSFNVDNIRQTAVSGVGRGNAGMVNIYYDFSDVILPTISPFLGLGIGYTYLQVSFTGNGPFETTLFKAHANSFAYQGMVGLTYNFAENFAINAAYRYFATSSSDALGDNFQAQTGSAGIIYRFDQCN